MATWREVAQGHSRYSDVPLELPSGKTCTVRLIAVYGDTHGDIEASAREYAKARGVAEPTDGDAAFDYGVAIYTVLATAIDPGTTPDNPAPFFSSYKEMMDPKTGLDPDRVQYLYQAQRIVQDSIALRKASMTEEEFFLEVVRHAALPEGHELPFASWRPGMQARFVRGMARALIGSAALRSTNGASSPASERNSTSSGSTSGEWDQDKISRAQSWFQEALGRGEIPAVADKPPAPAPPAAKSLTKPTGPVTGTTTTKRKARR